MDDAALQTIPTQMYPTNPGQGEDVGHHFDSWSFNLDNP
jgi:hypothetical protein